MIDLIIRNGNVVLPDRMLVGGCVHIDSGRILYVGADDETTQAREIVNAEGAIIAPGFVDIHCHGGGGVWSFEQPYEFALAHLKHGTTSILPTLSYNESKEQFRNGTLEILKYMKEESDAPFSSAIAGIHMEGPYINNKYGAITASIRAVDSEEYRELLDLAGSHIKVWTLAPELEGQTEFALAASKHGVALSVGHSEATAEQIFNLVPHGLRIGCHCTNACGVSPSPSRYGGTREIGVDEAVLVHDDIYAEVIPDQDGIHVRPLMLKLIHKTKGTDRVIIITDAMPGAGTAADDGRDVNYNHKGDLAGSKLTMDKAVRNMIKHTGVNLTDAFRMASLNPATAIGIAEDVGSLSVGKRANIILIDEEINVRSVYLDGKKFK